MPKPKTKTTVIFEVKLTIPADAKLADIRRLVRDALTSDIELGRAAYKMTVGAAQEAP